MSSTAPIKGVACKENKNKRWGFMGDCGWTGVCIDGECRSSAGIHVSYAGDFCHSKTQCKPPLECDAAKKQCVLPKAVQLQVGKTCKGDANCVNEGSRTTCHPLWSECIAPRPSSTAVLPPPTAKERCNVNQECVDSLCVSLARPELGEEFAWPGSATTATFTLKNTRGTRVIGLQLSGATEYKISLLEWKRDGLSTKVVPLKSHLPNQRGKPNRRFEQHDAATKTIHFFQTPVDNVKRLKIELVGARNGTPSARVVPYWHTSTTKTTVGACRAKNPRFHELGQWCSANEHCRSGTCDVPNQTCITKQANGAACSQDSMCQSGVCSSATKKCVDPFLAGQACLRDEECADGHGVCVNKKCTPHCTYVERNGPEECRNGRKLFNKTITLDLGAPATSSSRGENTSESVCGAKHPDKVLGTREVDNGACRGATGAACTAADQCDDDACFNNKCVDGNGCLPGQSQVGCCYAHLLCGTVSRSCVNGATPPFPVSSTVPATVAADTVALTLEVTPYPHVYAVTVKGGAVVFKVEAWQPNKEGTLAWVPIRPSNAARARGPGTMAYDPPEESRRYSSVHRGDAVGTGHARSRLASPQAWSAKGEGDQNAWMEIHLESAREISGVKVLPRADVATQRVTLFDVTIDSVFVGRFSTQQGGTYVSDHFFERTVTGTVIRIAPKNWKRWRSMRAGIYLTEPYDTTLFSHVANTAMLHFRDPVHSSKLRITQVDRGSLKPFTVALHVAHLQQIGRVLFPVVKEYSASDSARIKSAPGDTVQFNARGHLKIGTKVLKNDSMRGGEPTHNDAFLTGPKGRTNSSKLWADSANLFANNNFEYLIYRPNDTSQYQLLKNYYHSKELKDYYLQTRDSDYYQTWGHIASGSTVEHADVALGVTNYCEAMTITSDDGTRRYVDPTCAMTESLDSCVTSSWYDNNVLYDDRTQSLARNDPVYKFLSSNVPLNCLCTGETKNFLHTVVNKDSWVRHFNGVSSDQCEVEFSVSICQIALTAGNNINAKKTTIEQNCGNQFPNIREQEEAKEKERIEAANREARRKREQEQREEAARRQREQQEEAARREQEEEAARRQREQQEEVARREQEEEAARRQREQQEEAARREQEETVQANQLSQAPSRQPSSQAPSRQPSSQTSSRQPSSQASSQQPSSPEPPRQSSAQANQTALIVTAVACVGALGVAGVYQYYTSTKK